MGNYLNPKELQSFKKHCSQKYIPVHCPRRYLCESVLLSFAICHLLINSPLCFVCMSGPINMTGEPEMIQPESDHGRIEVQEIFFQPGDVSPCHSTVIKSKTKTKHAGQR